MAIIVLAKYLSAFCSGILTDLTFEKNFIKISHYLLLLGKKNKIESNKLPKNPKIDPKTGDFYIKNPRETNGFDH
ncbi:hypothetical protein [Cognataquiflexum aquatile]|uniref:hypothetical protein n=1 Tax=Cognataquiflexum aquatile TaxID=2249427 RepID=UPI000DEA272C|nr:hypothetical protein [Cognataquiflexum aquatile]